MANHYHYLTTRNAAKNSFTAIISEPVAGQHEFYIAPDLSNVLAMVNTYGEGNFGTIHVFNEKKLELVAFDTSIEHLAKDAVALSREYDDVGRDFAYTLSDNIPFVGGESVTFYMNVDPV